MNKKFLKTLTILLISIFFFPSNALAAVVELNNSDIISERTIPYKNIAVTETTYMDETGDISVVYGLSNDSLFIENAQEQLIDYIHSKQNNTSTFNTRGTSDATLSTFKLSYGNPIYDTVALESSTLTWTHSGNNKLILSGIRKLYGYNHFSASTYPNRAIGFEEGFSFETTSASLSISVPAGISGSYNVSSNGYYSNEKKVPLTNTEFSATCQFAGNEISATSSGITTNITGCYTVTCTIYYGTNIRIISDSNEQSF